MTIRPGRSLPAHRCTSASSSWWRCAASSTSADGYRRAVAGIGRAADCQGMGHIAADAGGRIQLHFGRARAGRVLRRATGRSVRPALGDSASAGPHHHRALVPGGLELDLGDRAPALRDGRRARNTGRQPERHGGGVQQRSLAQRPAGDPAHWILAGLGCSAARSPPGCWSPSAGATSSLLAVCSISPCC